VPPEAESIGKSTKAEVSYAPLDLPRYLPSEIAGLAYMPKLVSPLAAPFAAQARGYEKRCTIECRLLQGFECRLREGFHTGFSSPEGISLSSKG
jgi:hypothetical protein